MAEGWHYKKTQRHTESLSKNYLCQQNKEIWIRKEEKAIVGTFLASTLSGTHYYTQGVLT